MTRPIGHTALRGRARIRGVAWAVALAGAVFGRVVPIAAQAEPFLLGSEWDRYARALELMDSTVVWPLVWRSPSTLREITGTASLPADAWTIREGTSWGRPTADGYRRPPRFRVLAPELTLFYNSAFPSGTNDGAVWAGRGATIALSAGVQVRWGHVTATLYPAAFRSQNRDFETVPTSFPGRDSLGYPWRPNIDLPQRFGTEGYGRFDWGQSELRADVGWFTAAFSTENLWWGPAVENPLIMSNTAPGFPHVDLGTGRPVWIGVGHLETRFVWGRLAESPFFDTLPPNDGRFLRGLTLGFRPAFVPGLTLGATRVMYKTWDDSVTTRDYFRLFETVFKWARITSDNPLGEDRDDQLLSLTARWVFPASGFETYLEWARNDHSGDLRDFILEPDHSRAYTVGIGQAIRKATTTWLLRSEWTQLERSRTFEVRASPVYYVHHISPQGYTHRGQLLGAGIGPSASSLSLSVDRYDPRGRIGSFAKWVRYDNDAYYQIQGTLWTAHAHDVEVSIGVGAVRHIAPFDASLSLEVARERNRYFQISEEAFNDVTNVTVQAGLAWRPR